MYSIHISTKSKTIQQVCNAIAFYIGPRCRSGQIARPIKTSEMHPMFRARKFCLTKKKKSLDLQIYIDLDKTMKKLVNSKYYCENQCTCDILMSLYLIVLKLLYLLMDWETFNSFMTGVPVIQMVSILHTVEQVRRVISALQTPMMVLLTKVVSNINLKT